MLMLFLPVHHVYVVLVMCDAFVWVYVAVEVYLEMVCLKCWLSL